MEASVEETASEHHLFRTALAFPALAGLTVASYTVHGSIATAVFLYDAFCRRRHFVETGRGTRAPRIAAEPRRAVT
jgi:hypothetical protein